jgi:hypothetical protein
VSLRSLRTLRLCGEFEEFYARDLGGYYAALAAHPHHNCYMGRAEAILNEWTGYFIETLAQTFEAVAGKSFEILSVALRISFRR